MRRVWTVLRLILASALLLPVVATFVAEAARRDQSQGLQPGLVAFYAGYEPGTIVVRTTERRLYLILGDGQALRYPIAVGKAGKEWAGETIVARKVANPTWAAPDVVHRDHPELPQVIPPGPSNPLGPRALVLAADEYAIHGTNHPETIGTKASYGCIRMYNRDIVDLFSRVTVGTPVVVQ